MAKGFLYGNGGGSGKAYAVISATYPAGSTITCTDGSKSLKPQGSEGQALFLVPYAGNWTVTATNGTDRISQTVKITTEGQSASVGLSYLVPSEYQAVEFLQSSGSQHIQTGINTNDCYGVVLDVQSLSFADNRWFAGNWNNSSYHIGMQSNTFHSNVGRGSGVSVPFDTDRHAMGFKKSRYIFDEMEFDAEPAYDAAKLNQIIPLFARLTMGSDYYCAPSMKLYRAQMFNIDAELVRDFVPCYRKADNVAGLWDRISETFFTNAGSGTFIVGEDI